MEFHPEVTAVMLTIPFVGLNGASLSRAATSLRVLQAWGVVVPTAVLGLVAAIRSSHGRADVVTDSRWAAGSSRAGQEREGKMVEVITAKLCKEID